MAACAHNPQHMEGKCPSMKVATEFNQADKGTGILKEANRRIGARKAFK